MRKKRTFICQQCGKQFNSSRKSPICCSKECATQRLRNRVTKKCEACGKDMSVNPGLLHRKRYCSKECKHAGQKRKVEWKCSRCGKIKHLKPSEAQEKQYCSVKCANNKDSKITLECPVCKKVFYRFPCRLKDGKKHYCSKECHHEDMKNKGIWRTLVCASCGEEYQTTVHQIEKRDSKYCSLECKHNGSHKRDGALSYYWRKTAASVRKRDKYTCALCGKFQRKPALDVHHIVPARTFATEDLDKANDPLNLVSLCRTCHRSVETDPTAALSLSSRLNHQ